jgi:hypothetical protein
MRGLTRLGSHLSRLVEDDKVPGIQHRVACGVVGLRGFVGSLAVPLGFALEDHCVEAVADSEPGVFIERHG